MRNLKKWAFTLVELLVVITILAILSVVAYQSFGWVTDKAQNATKVNNLTILGSTLGLFKTAENYYPMPQAKSATNLWGYDSSATAQQSNYLEVNYQQAEIASLLNASNFIWWWVVYWSGTWALGGADESQVWAKWVIWEEWSFNKKYLPKEVYDTQLWDINLTASDEKMINYWIGKFSYAVYARQALTSAANWNTSWTIGSYYELAWTLKTIDAEWYTTYLGWDYSGDNFSWADSWKYPDTLMWLVNEQKDNNVTTKDPNQGIPYPIDNFAWVQLP